MYKVMNSYNTLTFTMTLSKFLRSLQTFGVCELQKSLKSFIKCRSVRVVPVRIVIYAASNDVK